MRIRLPFSVAFKCPHCGFRFVTLAKLLSKKSKICCPACGFWSTPFYFLSAQLRRKAYWKLRELLELKYGKEFFETYRKYAPDIGLDYRSPW